MFEGMSSREFEEFCQALLQCHYRCKVELTKQTGDEGRDLLVFLPDGLEVVECKHWPDGTVGRPAVQKLHSAILTANARRGKIITTGRFSSEAEAYLKKLNDVSIELVDKAKLDYLIQRTYPDGRMPEGLLKGVRTTPEAEFRQVFIRSIFSANRYQSSPVPTPPAQVRRVTRYECYFVASFHAEGTLDTAVGIFSETWNGSVWLSDSGNEASFEAPRSSGGVGPLVPLGEVLRDVPGTTAPPQLQPHQAVKEMRAFVASHCAKLVSYHGRNNRHYCRRLKPSPDKIQVDSLKLCYVPVQEFVLELGGARVVGSVDERGSPTHFVVNCPALSTCSVCGTATTAENQVFCAVCCRPAHRKSLFFPDSFQCQKCCNVVCRNHAVRIGQQIACDRCAPKGTRFGPRWSGHCRFGMVASAVVALACLITVFSFCASASGSADVGIVCVIASGLLVGLAVWIPALWMIVQSSILPKHRRLIYPKVEVRRQATNKPDWLYGNSS